MLNKIKQFINNHFTITAFMIFAVVIFSLYGKSLFFDWTYLDDDILIIDKQDYLKISNIKNIFLGNVFGEVGDITYRPFLNISFMLDKYVYGLNPHGYHLTNILIFLFSIFFIYLVFSYKHDRRLSLFLCILISVHPILSDIVAWIPGRNDSLLTLFVISSFYFLNIYIKTDKFICLLLHIFLLVLSLFSKETAIVIPFILFVFVLLFNNSNKKQNIFLLILWIISTFIFLIFRYFTINCSTDISLSYVFVNISNNFMIITKYFYNLLFPIKIYLNIYIDLLLFLLTLIFYIFIIIKYNYLNKKLLFFCCFSFVVIIVPTIINITNVYSCNRIFLPMIFMFYLLLDIIDKNKIKRIFFLIFILLFFVYSCITYIYINKFRNRWIFYNTSIIENPTEPFFYAKLGMMLLDLKMYDEAEKKLLKAIELAPNNFNHYNNIAVIYMNTNKFAEAKKYLLIAKQLNERDENTNYNLNEVEKYLELQNVK